MPWWPRWPDVHDSREPPGLRLPCLTRIFQNLAKRQNRRLLFAISTIFGYVGVLGGDGSSMRFARRSYDFFAVAITLASLMLGLLLLMRDFRIEYVHQYSGLDLPIHYQFAAFWAGQKGSFLIWLLWGTLIGLLVRKTAGRN